MSEVTELNQPSVGGFTRLAQAIRPLVSGHPQDSGIYPLAEGLDAFAARYLLIAMAEKTLDIQYYIWENDMSGQLLFSAVLEAARRGVRVRLLLDDNNTLGLDKTLSALNSHPNIDVRLFNPFSFRTLRLLGYLTDFARLNRRMHNKSFTVDGEASIVGGRNVGDKYFGAGDEPLFSDLDVLAVGSVVEEVGDDFERYWQCRSVAPFSTVVDMEPGSEADIGLQEGWRENEQVKHYFTRLQESTFITRLESRTLPFIWASSRLLSDDPRKGLGRARTKNLLPQRLLSVIGRPQEQLDIISAYFVPTRAGVAQLLALVRRGVKIAILTNSLAANDVSVVHAGYAKWRKKLLRHGIALYELKPTTTPPGGVLHDRGLTGNSGSSLHAKTFSVDQKTVFIGSFNFDPRSAVLNTEMGLVIESGELANSIHQNLLVNLREHAWTLRLDERGKINWVEYPGEAEEVVHRHEPRTRFIQRLLVRLVWRLPIEWLL
ncbi:phospholipase D family protein [Erwinia sp. S43]|uniref:phospholipase D family protein n=1 Tax=Erwinia sp. S43 TaxID=2769339 RepID=UPI00190CFD61|nr:phospholipase D family protein [Erwinia sp. S43]MBK0032778.1 phospholipase D family protein [Erwinia sp. S43]